ncbi:glycoside hydrolase family 75 protein [Streptomyces sp. NPDC057433]|uniref:glycoside hydrolase family 75 protein n=1 Tax=Streptomyces sp. NPDC057433 TaxID=3346132 RepID=UPI00367A2540
MPVQPLALAVAGVAVLTPTMLHSTSSHSSPSQARSESPAAQQEGSVDAADLLAAVRDCTPVSRGMYRSDRGAPATIPVCGTDGAVFWKADMDIDCDGQPSARCSTATDPYFSASTAFAQSDGRPLNSATLPFVVVPVPSALWDYRAHGVRGGSVVAVVYGHQVRYAVVGDTGPADIIGEASYATAEALGIDPDPRSGGARSGVTYIVFRGSRVTPLEDRKAAVAAGEELARRFVHGG